MQIKRTDFDPAQSTNFIQYQKAFPLRLPKFNKWTNWYDYIRVSNTESPPPDPRGYLNLPEIQGVDRFQSYKEQVDKDRQLTLAAINTIFPLPKIDANGQVIRDENGHVMYESVAFRDIYKYPKEIQSKFLTYLNSVIGTGKFQDPKYRKMAEILTKQITGIERPVTYTSEKKNP